MNQKVLILNICYEKGLYSFKEDFPLEVQELLKQSEIKYTSFKQTVLTNVDELVEEIAGEQFTSILFFAEPISYLLIQVLSNKINAFSSEYRIFVYTNRKEKEYGIENVKFVDNDDLVNSLTDENKLSEKELKGQKGQKNNVGNVLVNSQSDLQGEEAFQTMSNGYIAYTTGIYPESAVGLFSKHIGYTNIEDNKYITFLGEYLNVNSAIIELCNSYSLETYKNRIDKSLENNIFIPHYHQKVIEDNFTRIYVDNSSQYINTIECDYTKFYKLEQKDEVDSSVLYTLSINCMEDLESFLKDVELFESEGLIRYPNFILKDECRWQMKCNLKYLPRMDVTSEGEIKPCLGSEKILGTINDSYYVNIRKAAKSIDKEYLQRECKECNIKNICSKCSMLPDFLDRESYCDFRKKNPMIVDFLNKKNMYYYLYKFSGTINIHNVGEIRFSNVSYSILFPNNKEYSYDITKNIYLMFFNNKHLLFNYVQKSLYEIDEYLAFILEGYLKSCDEKKIVIFFSEKYNRDSEKSRTTVSNGFELLRNAGIIR
ncbi:hypothetical protein KPL42_11930 [Clostridium gasigenes]|uniref:hypothetical protein n=1 Tax=Clostridium gasigenes TaxID=94869 RepID=UPI001C0CF0DE|nr:hypothetical protein [Clostridium gasigenes]MBU3089196.1 hypothetical protein [Clostridium gasigenes]